MNAKIMRLFSYRIYYNGTKRRFSYYCNHIQAVNVKYALMNVKYIRQINPILCNIGYYFSAILASNIGFESCLQALYGIYIIDAL